MKDGSEKSWIRKQLTQIAAISSGNSISAKDRAGKFSAANVEGRHFISTKDVGFDGNITHETQVVIPTQNQDDFKLAPKGSTLVCSEGGSAGRKVGLLKEDVHYGNKLFAITANNDVLPEMVHYFCQSDDFVEQFQGRKTGLIGGVSLSKFKTIEMLVPPLEEQQRIVAILDEAFEGLSRARAHAEANLQNARELSEASVDAIFDRLPDTTPVNELQNFCTERGITYGVIKLGEHDPEGVPCLRTSNVRPLRIDTAGMKWIAPGLSNEYRRTILEGGEVLVNVRGTLGGVATVPEDMAGWNISREVAMVPVDRARLDPDFASFFISTRKAQQWLTGVVKGAAYKGINLTDLRLLKIPVPSLEAQHEIIDEIKELRERMIIAEEAYERKLSDLNDLRQSLLQNAFAGELTRRESA